MVFPSSSRPIAQNIKPSKGGVFFMGLRRHLPLRGSGPTHRQRYDNMAEDEKTVPPGTAPAPMPATDSAAAAAADQLAAVHLSDGQGDAPPALPGDVLVPHPLDHRRN